ncbi:hypothetical protein G9F72_010825 [Clostridium estertheticum]|uniref:helix-turn-helix domain-containing protein n=1 Tax=Clostridium estertheticum TaxID=238834 RepID=UPI0013E96979|nr:helix-turn-helix domain-containing protein [Clostridium estertheticum]MBZ9686818.1 hypothetical protein [Clostridium estertheticum]
MPHYLKENILGSLVKENVQIDNTSLPSRLRNFERKLIVECLNNNNWNFSKTAKKLGIIRQSLEYRMKKLGIEKKEDI